MIHFVRDDNFDIVKVYENGIFVQQYALGMLCPQRISVWEKGSKNAEIQLVQVYAPQVKPIHTFAISEIDAPKCVPSISIFANDIEKMLGELNKLFSSDWTTIMPIIEQRFNNINL